ncbi:MAG: hypothetical protein PQJ58_21450 [Spirochaetales bacterium]|nr:hypothetical protein [Spirochaetales bacterium]
MRGSVLYFLLALLLIPVPLFCQPEPSDRDTLLREIDAAGAADFYDKALSLIDQGVGLYPEDHRFPMLRGDLYEEQELYGMALESYREAEALDRDNSVELRTKLASVLGYLDRNFESLSYLEALVAEGSQALLDDLGWMYFKTHQPEKGIGPLQAALDDEFSRNLSLTLGTLYSELNDAEMCRKYYLEAIHDALDDQDSYFASVGYYNLSLAEKSFYDYEAAVDYASRSIDLMNRSAGHLALGDLYMMKQSFRDAEREFNEAVELDKTPLSRTNLAALYRIQGRLDESLFQIRKIEETDDDSWMYYYGLNQDQFVMDLYEQFSEAYEGKVQRLILFREWGVSARFQRISQIVVNKVKALYYRTLFRLLSYREGRSQLEGGSELRGALTLAAGAEGFSGQAEKYYLRALSLEDFSQAEPWYDLVLGDALKDETRLKLAQERFDPEWERQPLEDTLRSRAQLMRGRSPEKNEILSRMYRMNPGSLVQYGLKLPVVLDLSGSEASAPLERRIRRLLRGSGFYLPENREGLAVLRMNVGDRISYVFSDTDGTVLISGNLNVEDDLRNELRHWVRRFRSEAFQF